MCPVTYCLAVAQRSCLCGLAHMRGSMPCGPASNRPIRPSGTDARIYCGCRPGWPGCCGENPPPGQGTAARPPTQARPAPPPAPARRLRGQAHAWQPQRMAHPHVAPASGTCASQRPRGAVRTTTRARKARSAGAQARKAPKAGRAHGQPINEHAFGAWAHGHNSMHGRGGRYKGKGPSRCGSDPPIWAGPPNRVK